MSNWRLRALAQKIEVANGYCSCPGSCIAFLLPTSHSCNQSKSGCLRLGVTITSTPPKPFYFLLSSHSTHLSYFTIVLPLMTSLGMWGLLSRTAFPSSVEELLSLLISYFTFKAQPQPPTQTSGEERGFGIHSLSWSYGCHCLHSAYSYKDAN